MGSTPQDCVMFWLVPLEPRLSEIPDSLTTDEFWERFGQLEHERLDFKRRPSQGLDHVFAAMAMTDGGLVVLGIADDRQLVGCPKSQDVQDIVMRAAHGCGVDVQLKEIRVGRHRLTAVAVPEVRGRIVTTTDGRLLRRVGSSNLPLLGDALARFVTERTERSAEEEVVPSLELDDLDVDLVSRALVGAGRPATTRSGLIRALVDLGVANAAGPLGDAEVMRAAVLLFAANAQKYVPSASVQLVRRTGVGPGPGATEQRAQYSGPLPSLLGHVLSFIDRHTGKTETVVGAHREAVAEYPIAVVREAVLNALAHRDYGLAGATVDVTVWQDRIEIRSPGPLPGHITIDNIREEHYSRNRRVMHVLKLLGLVEEYGEGVDRMFREMEARLMDPPTFVATPSSVTVTLKSRSVLSVEDQVWLSLVGHVDLSPQERRLLVLAKNEGSVTRRRVRAVISDADAEALLSTAVTKGLLVRRGERGGASYQLSDEVVVRAGAAGLEARSRQRQILLDEMHRRGGLSTSEAAEILRQGDKTLVRTLLNDLVSARLAVARGKTRARKYFST